MAHFWKLLRSRPANSGIFGNRRRPKQCAMLTTSSSEKAIRSRLASLKSKTKRLTFQATYDATIVLRVGLNVRNEGFRALFQQFSEMKRMNDSNRAKKVDLTIPAAGCQPSDTFQHRLCLTAFVSDFEVVQSDPLIPLKEFQIALFAWSQYEQGIATPAASGRPTASVNKPTITRRMQLYEALHRGHISGVVTLKLWDTGGVLDSHDPDQLI